AIKAVRQMGRNPYEVAIASVFQAKNPFRMVAELESLLDCCRT
ncbi:protein phosphatase, partial [Chroococcidiopsis cubana CCALA 043]